MKKRKGFTLVELLGVMVVLAIILVLSVPPIINQLSKSKKETYEAGTEVIYNATVQYLEDNVNLKQVNKLSKPEIYCISLKTLVSDGKLKEPIKNLETNETYDLDKAYIRLAYNGINSFDNMSIVTDGSCSSTPTYLITPSGWSLEKEVEIIYPENASGKKYSVNGGAWKDYTSKVKFTSNGTIQAKSIDTSGKEAVSAERTVAQIDTTAPESVTFTTTVSSSTITVKAIGKDKESGISKYQFSKDGGTTWSDPQSSSTYIFDKLSANTSYQINVRAINSTYESLRKTSSNPISDKNSIIGTAEIVKTDPVSAPTFKLSPNQTTTGKEWATSRTVTINYDSGFNKFYKIDDGQWQEYINNFTVTKNCTIYAYITDGSLVETGGTSNSAQSSIAVLNIDTTPPTTPTATMTSSTSSITITAKGAVDNESGIYGYQFSIDGGKSWTNIQKSNVYTFNDLLSGSYTVKVRVINNTYPGEGDVLINSSGISNYSESQNYSISTSASPTVTVSASPISWSQSKKITITSSAGTLKPQYSIDSGGTWTDYSGSVTINENCTVLARVTDGTNYFTSPSLTITTIDNTAPTVAGFNYTSTLNSIDVIAYGVDDESDIYGYQFSKDNGQTWTSIQTDKLYTFTGLSASTKYQIRVKVINNTFADTNAVNANNSLVSDMIEVTTESPFNPEVKIEPNGWSVTKNLFVDVSSENANQSKIQYSYDSGTTWLDYPNKLEDESGNYYDPGVVVDPCKIVDDTCLSSVNVLIRQLNATTNEELGSTSYTIEKLDGTPPTISSVNYSIYGGKVTLDVDADDRQSGIYGYQFSLDGQTWSSIQEESSYTFDYDADFEYNIIVRAINNTYENSSLVDGNFTDYYDVDLTSNEHKSILFDYTGTEQVYVVPETGVYKLETWGASGGYAYDSTRSTGGGGYGGYSTGLIELQAGEKLYVNIGGEGESNCQTTTCAGGYNGGSTSSKWASNNGAGLYTAGGGGATHISTKSGLLSSLEDSKDDILIVSGGGGGGDYYPSWSQTASGASGGGFEGGLALSNNAGGAISTINGTNGTQTSGYAFGKGGTTYTSDSAGGSGGGFYGGLSSTVHVSGGGGSGYIGNPLLTSKKMYCYKCNKSNNEETKTASTEKHSTSPIANYAKEGNGYSKITLIESYNENEYAYVEKYDYTGKEETFVAPVAGKYKLQVWGAQGYSVNSYNGGYGAYSTGIVELEAGDKLYVNVGEQGKGGSKTGSTYSSYPNGGLGKGNDGVTSVGSGGGSTNITLTSGSLSSTSTSNILIVGSGGGAAIWTTNSYWAGYGGSGGGISGSSGKSAALGASYTSGGGATQAAGGSAGNDANAGSFGAGGSCSGNNCSGGGGGFYGGGGSWGSGAGGGSGYIGNSLLTKKVMYCYECSESSNANTKTISTSKVSEYPIDNYAKSGNGYAIISLDTNPIDEFEYTGSEQTFTATKTGKYKVELWGAQGNSSTAGGLGSYTSGEINLQEGDKLYLHVGGSSGYNGGGSSSSSTKIGGGATDVRLSSGSWDNFDGLKSRIMVAAGGGNVTSKTSGALPGDGGTLKGGNGVAHSSVGSSYIGYGGSQTSGGARASSATTGSAGSFGKGGAGGVGPGDPNHYGSGGGGGYYGGGGSAWHAGSGGGSSYISGYEGCNSISSTSTSSSIKHTGSPIHYSGMKFDNSTMKGAVNSGNGYAKISFIKSATVPSEYHYTGSEETFTAPTAGTYKLEVWGAQGGDATSTYIGGYGAYSTGTVELQAGDKLYINVGGQGTGGTNATFDGGYNGGGGAIGATCNGDVRYQGSGGGATSIAKASGLLSTLSSKQSSILIVAGGGSGASTSAYGSHAGGYVGKDAYWTESTTKKNYAGGGTQTAGGIGGSSYNDSLSPSGSFGLGGTHTGGSCNEGSGGGGGFYGGGASAFKPGGGGSGYIGNSLLKDKVMYCYNCTQSTIESTKTVSTTNVSSSPRSYYPKQGNGHAKITLITTSNTKEEYNYSGFEEVYVAPTTGTYKLETWGAQGGDADITRTGGYGGYATGTVNLTAGDKLYINVGGKGSTCSTSNSTCQGGYNGGGTAKAYSQSTSTSAGGGGATHIATISGLLSSLNNNKGSILIASGGGGGGHYTNSVNGGVGGVSGGYTGMEPTSLLTDTKSSNGRYAQPGNQTAGGCTKNSTFCGGFGYGHSMGSSYGSGGGAGYYGGSGADIGPGAGGSGYIGNSLLTNKLMYCYKCDEASDSSTRTNSTTNVSNQAIANYSKKGNGAVKITLLSNELEKWLTLAGINASQYSSVDDVLASSSSVLNTLFGNKDANEYLMNNKSLINKIAISKNYDEHVVRAILNSKSLTPSDKLLSGLTYSVDGLEAFYDGIYNNGVDSNHSNTVTNWKDLMRTKNGLIFAGSWGNNYLYFNGTSSYVALKEMNYDNPSLDTYVKFDSLGTDYSSVVGNWESGGYGIEVTKDYTNITACVSSSYRNTRDTTTQATGVKSSYTMSYDGDRVKAYTNGELKAIVQISGTISKPVSNTIMMLGTNPTSDQPAGNYFQGRMYATRIYSRPISSSEVARNRLVDTIRFEDESTDSPSDIKIDGIYRIASYINTSYVLDVYGASKSDGANIQLYSSTNSSHQQFRISHVSGDYYSIINVNSSKSLDILNASTASNTNIQQYTYNGSNGQLWKFNQYSGTHYYAIRSKLGTAVDAYGGTAANGTNIDSYAYNGSDAQKWKLIKIGE